MRHIYISLAFACFTISGFTQNAMVDSLKSIDSYYSMQQTEPVNVYYDQFNSKLVVENNTKQTHNFLIGIYNLTGTPIQETKNECLIGKSIDIQVELKPGLYIINIVDKPIVFTKKFIIQ